MEKFAAAVLAAILFAGVKCENLTTPQQPEVEIPLNLLRLSGLFETLEASGTKYVNLSKEEPSNSGRPRTLAVKGSIKDGLPDVERTVRQHQLNYPQAGCDPYDQIVEIPNDKPNVQTIPSCIQLKRCGGCCPHSALGCKATSTEMRSVEITKFVYNGETLEWDNELAYVEMEEHTKCECQCKVNETTCNPDIHKYDGFNCECQCLEGKQDCPSHKQWDESICACKCTQVLNCGAGFIYNKETCRCEADTERSSHIVLDNMAASPTLKPGTDKITTAKAEPCPNLVCPRRYKAVKGDAGRCYCWFFKQAQKSARG